MRFVKHIKIITILLLNSSISLNAYSKPLHKTEVPSSTDSCKRHPIQCAILTLQPSLGSAESLLLSNLIHKYSLKHKVDPYRLVAIAMQESSLQNINRTTPSGIITDVGIFQFNVGTIDAFNLDFMRLQEDVSYAVERAAWLLSVKLKECSDLGKDAWACFHSRSVKNRLAYKHKVDAYYNKIIKFKPLQLEELGQI